MSDDYTHGDNLPDPWGDAIDKPNLLTGHPEDGEPMSDLYVSDKSYKEMQDEIERLRADCKEKDRLIETQKQYLDNKDSVIKGMNEMVKKLETGTLNKDSAIQG